MGENNLKNVDVLRVAVNPQPEALMTADEAATFLGYRKGYLYKLTCRKEIPFIKYGGRIILFDRDALAAWKAGRMRPVPTRDELASKAEVYCNEKPLKR